MTRVAMLAPISWPTPPRGYGPWEQVVATLTDALVDLGVNVTLYATGDSHTCAALRWGAPRGYEDDSSYDVKVFRALHIARVFEAWSSGSGWRHWSSGSGRSPGSDGGDGSPRSSRRIVHLH